MVNLDAGTREELERLRKKCKRAKPMHDVCVMLGILGFLVVVVLGLLGTIDVETAAIIGFPVIIIILIINAILPSEAKAKMKYAKVYKQRIAEPILRSCFETIRYSPEQGFSKREFTDTGVMAVAHTMLSYISEDLIEGEYEGITFRQADVKIKIQDIPVYAPLQYDAVNKKYVRAPQPQSTEKHKYTHKMIWLNGCLTQFHYKKSIQGKIRIISKDFKYQSATEDIPLVIGDSDNFMAAGSYTGGISSTVMEDVEFNKRFNVYATDAHSVFYLLTPLVMEYFKQLYEIDHQVVICFDGESLYIYRAGKGGIFEPPVKSPVQISMEEEKCMEDMKDIMHCIEALRLDEKQKREEELQEVLEKEKG